MSRIPDITEDLRQNLVDTGCGEENIKKCVKFAEEGRWEKILSVLLKQKSNLLDDLHFSQRQIDCLDFLVYKINKNFKEKI